MDCCKPLFEIKLRYFEEILSVLKKFDDYTDQKICLMISKNVSNIYMIVNDEFANVPGACIVNIQTERNIELELDLKEFRETIFRFSYSENPFIISDKIHDMMLVGEGKGCGFGIPIKSIKIY